MGNIGPHLKKKGFPAAGVGDKQLRADEVCWLGQCSKVSLWSVLSRTAAPLSPSWISYTVSSIHPFSEKGSYIAQYVLLPGNMLFPGNTGYTLFLKGAMSRHDLVLCSPVSYKARMQDPRNIGPREHRYASHKKVLHIFLGSTLVIEYFRLLD